MAHSESVHVAFEVWEFVFSEGVLVAFSVVLSVSPAAKVFVVVSFTAGDFGKDRQRVVQVVYIWRDSCVGYDGDG